VGAPLGPIRQLRRIVGLFDAARLVARVDRVFGMSETTEAHRYLESGAAVGKVGIRVA
jgi:NADPH:quinone reductase-like Zn-dependent oxidoreductase